MRCSIFLLTSALAAFTSAASSSNITADAFYSMIPACARACDMKALSSDGCAINDFACHCAKPEEVGRVIGPCIMQQSNCTAADLNQLSSAVQSVCHYPAFNISGYPPFASMNHSGGHGGSYPGSGSSPYGNGSYGGGVAPYTGAATSIKSAGAGMMVLAAAAVVLL